MVRRIYGLALLGVLTGCVSHQTPAPVEAFSPTYSVSRGTHLVKQGESINSIAWRYGRDVEEIKAINKLEDGSKLRAGQVIALSEDSLKRQRNTSEGLGRRPGRKPASERQHPIGMVKKEQQVAAYTPPPEPQVLEQDNHEAQAMQAQAMQPVDQEPVQETRYEPSAPILAEGAWGWPVRQPRVIEAYHPESHAKKGILLGGALGDPVLASASGTVVYKGNGIRGYGLMVIVKHDNNFLSAYGHNNAVLVNEGDRVISGQKIAEMGQTDADKVQLHFEIRRNGKPVDPMSFLNKQPAQTRSIRGG